MGLLIGLMCILLTILFLWLLFSRVYSLPCPSWLAWMVEIDNPFVKTNRALTIIENLDVQPGMLIVDVGCGPGRLTIPLAKKLWPGGEIVAMDIQQKMLQKVKAKAQEANLTNISYLNASAGEGKLKHTTYDRALLVNVLGEIANQELALKEIFAALKPGGILSVTEIIFDPHYQRRGTVLKLARAVGFKEKAIFGSFIAFTINLEKPI